MNRFLRTVVKPLLPPEMWSAARTRWQNAQYAWLWRHRYVVTFDRFGQKISFTIVNPKDVIQREQAKGKFYEEEELTAISEYFPHGGVFVDIGSNTGQHAIYAAKLMGASKIILFEPIEAAYKIIRENIRLNDLVDISDLSHLGIGLSDKIGSANFSLKLTNLGGTNLSEDSEGVIRIANGDSLLSNEKVDFIKIDTEGFELKVLSGLSETISREKPIIFVEVDNENSEEFQNFIKKNGYKTIFSNKVYNDNENFLISPG